MELKKILKKTKIVLSITVLALIISGCSHNNESTSTEEVKTTVEIKQEVNEVEVDEEVVAEPGVEEPTVEEPTVVTPPAEEAVVVKTFQVSGENYKFTMDGKDSPEIRVNKGDTVKITFTSTDGFHDFVVDELNAASKKVKTGETTTLEFIADTAGSFEYYCSVGSHRANGMFGKLIVE